MIFFAFATPSLLMPLSSIFAADVYFAKDDFSTFAIADRPAATAACYAYYAIKFIEIWRRVFFFFCRCFSDVEASLPRRRYAASRRRRRLPA